MNGRMSDWWNCLSSSDHEDSDPADRCEPMGGYAATASLPFRAGFTGTGPSAYCLGVRW
jgi:hypothetical protein